VKRLGILLSGRGSNFEAIANSIEAGKLPGAEIAIVISNRASARGLEIARSRGIPCVAIPSAGMDRETYDGLLIQKLQEFNVDLICLAGFMRLLSTRFVEAFPQKILNIHPSLLPAFPGLDAQHQAIDYGVKIAGCTVHLVDEFLDSGPIILQRTVGVQDDDTAETLSDRILIEEHLAYTEAIRIILEGNYRVAGRKVIRG
jgi:phosphoribosylglycinamide formyltransferase-1